MTRQVKDVATSVHNRLLNLSKSTGRPFNEVFQLYAMERFLYRLSRSKHSNSFVLKGGLMLRVWKAPVTRPTKDVDLLGHTANTVANLVSIVQGVCAQPVDPDGMQFDATTAVGSLIKEDAEYNGIRVKFIGRLGVARASMQIDVGFGDAVEPPPLDIELPTLLDFPAPKLRGYQRETTIAEKFHAMVVLGTLNGLMKDFYDIWLLSQSFDFERDQLAKAINSTFAARATAIEPDPVAFGNEFARSDDAQRRWSAFLKKSAIADAPTVFTEVVSAIGEFLLPLTHPSALRLWQRGGPWR